MVLKEGGREVGGLKKERREREMGGAARRKERERWVVLREGRREVCGPARRKGEKKACKMFASKYEHASRKHDLNDYQMLHDS